MPVYEYRCNRCGSRQELTHSMRDTIQPRCKECRDWMRLLYTPAASVFIGEGWAKKDRQKKEAK